MDEHNSQDAIRPTGPGPSQGQPASASRPQPAGTFDPRDLVPEPLFCCDGEGRLVWMNGAAEQLTGHPSHELLGQGYPMLFPYPERRRITRDLVRLARGGGDFYYEAPFVAGTGHVHWVGLKVKAIRAANGHRGYVASAHDLQAIHQQLEDLKRRERELQARLEEATAASRLKSDFLATMSHEIRNPMNGVIGMSRMLTESNLDRDQRMWADVILQSGEALLQLVNDILDFSKIEAGKLDLESIDFDLRVAVDQCAALLGTRAAEKRVTFASIVNHRVPSRLVGDPGRLRQVLLNLAGNAIKFTEEGTVEIRVDLAEETAHQVVLRFSVNDTGIGIAQEHVDKIFESFVQGDPSVARRYGGSGLGLSITRRLVSLMGGEVGFTSELGKGSTFWFMVPVKKQPEDAQPVALPEVELHGSRVLLADPSPAVRASLSEMLQAWGCMSEEVEDGLQALDRMRKAADRGAPFQIVIVDMDLPVLDPESFAGAVRAEKALGEPSLMLLTNLGRRGDAAHAQDWGYAAYLLKPIQVSHFHEALLHVVSGHRMVSVPPGSKVSTTPRLITRHTIAEQQRQRLRVLIVEDNPVNQLVAVAALRRVGYAPEVVSTGQAALDAAAAGHFDMIFMDIMLEDLGGLEVTRRIRAAEQGHRTPIVAMTAHVRHEEKARCFEAGMDDYLSKPIDLEQMCKLVEHWARGTPAHGGAAPARDANDDALAGAAIGTFLEAPAEESARRNREAAATPPAASAEPQWTDVRVDAPGPEAASPVQVTTWSPEPPAAAATGAPAWNESPSPTPAAEAPARAIEFPGWQPPPQPEWLSTSAPAAPAPPSGDPANESPPARFAMPFEIPGPAESRVEAVPDPGASWESPASEAAAPPAAVPDSAPGPVAETRDAYPALTLVPRDALHDRASSMGVEADPAPSAQDPADGEVLPDLAAQAEAPSFKPQSWDEARDASFVEAPVLDWSRLEVSSMGTPELRVVLIKAFHTQSEPRLERLRTAVAAADGDAVEFEAHALRGMCATIGAMRCAEVFEHLERLGREKRLEPAAYKLQRAETEVQRVQEMLLQDRSQAA